MFVVINNVDMNINDVEKWIKAARDYIDGVISPESALEILSKTNHLGHIKKVLRNIKDKCTTPEEMAPYKEFILSCIDGREMSPQTLENLNELADLCGSKDELEKINKKYKYYDTKACEKNAAVSSQEELEALTGTDLDVLFVQEKEDEHDQYMIFDVDFAGVKKLRFNELANIHIQGGKNFPKDMDFSNCWAILINFAIFNGDENIKWASLSDMSSVRNIPVNTDLSNCREVRLEHCSFAKDGELKLGGVCDIERTYFPKKTDLSKCDEIYSEFPISFVGVEEVKFKNKSQIYEFSAKLADLPAKIVYDEVEKNGSFAEKFMNLFGQGRR